MLHRMFTRLHAESVGKIARATETIVFYLSSDYNDSILVYVIMQSTECDLHGGAHSAEYPWPDEITACNRYRVHDE